MAHLDGDILDRRGDQAQHGEVVGMAVARDDLGGDRLHRQAHLLGDMFFHRRINIGKRADGAGNGASGDLLAGAHQAFAIAGKLGIEAREFQAHRRRLGMDAVRAADTGGVFVLFRPRLQRRKHPVHAFQQQVGGLFQLHGEAGVQHIRGGQALVDETALLADMLGQMGEEGDDIMLHLGLDLIDPVDIELDVFCLPDSLDRRLRHHTQLGQLLRRMRLDQVPDLVLVLVRPDGGHFRTGIAGDHRRRSAVHVAEARGMRRNGPGVKIWGCRGGVRRNLNPILGSRLFSSGWHRIYGV